MVMLMPALFALGRREAPPLRVSAAYDGLDIELCVAAWTTSP